MENLFKTLHLELKKQAASGATNKELAAQAGCSQQRINQLLNSGGLEKVKLETLLRLFPNMRITLDGMATAATDEEAAELLGLFRTLNSAGRAHFVKLTITGPAKSRMRG